VSRSDNVLRAIISLYWAPLVHATLSDVIAHYRFLIIIRCTWASMRVFWNPGYEEANSVKAFFISDIVPNSLCVVRAAQLYSASLAGLIFTTAVPRLLL
jgi:hypothetical protein